MGSANFPNRPFRLEDRTAILQQSSTASLIRTELWIIKNSYSPTYSFVASSYEQDLGGSVLNSGTFTYDFRNTDSLLLSRVDRWVNHDSNGYLNYWVHQHCDAQVLGTVDYTSYYSAPRIAQVPPAPINGTLDQITPTSMRYQFHSNGDGGSGVLEWQIAYDTQASFATAQTMSSSGTSTLTGLLSGTTYYVRSRGRNSVGWGAWSSVSSAKTLSSVKVSDGTDWVTPQITVSNGSVWQAPEIYVSINDTWIIPSS